MGNGNVDYSVLKSILSKREVPKDLPLPILASITDEFSEHRKIGAGGFSVVYKGVLENWSVAVKRITVNRHNIDDDDKQFRRELKSLLRIIDHPNVVRFLGFCYNNTHRLVEKSTGSEETVLVEVRERLLCFEYISNGSLQEYITDELRGLEWNVRYQIIKGICEGLQYLHNEMNIIHMDLKPANIMVDTDMLPKITDFGLARLDENKCTTGVPFFSRGYCAPEYINIGNISRKLDIYSLGVMINKMVTGRKKIPNKDRVIPRWRLRWRKSGTYTPLQVQQITKCIEIAERCAQNEPGSRPSISDIMRDLNESANTNVYLSGVDQIPYLDNDDMLGIEPLELRFAFELNKEIISNKVELTNITDNCIAFNIKTVSHKTVSQLQYLYCTRPNKGIVPPKSNITVKITLRTQEVTQGRSMPHDDEFIVQSTKVEYGLTDEKINEDMFNDEAGKVVDEVKLTVVYDDQSMKPQADQSSLEPNAPVNEGTNLREQPCAVNSRDHMPVTVNAMTGAMGRLLPKLLELLKQEHNLLKSLKICFEDLERKLKIMHAGLYILSQAQQDQLDKEAKIWAKEVRELSYDTEDIVDDLIVRIEYSEPITDQDGIKKRVKDILRRVKERAEWYDTYILHSPVPTPAILSSTGDPRMPDLYKDHRELVGIDGQRDKLVERLSGWRDEASSKQQLKIVSIFGEGGLGKTTLAKSVFDRLTQEFHLKAFVSVGRSPDAKRLLKNILHRLDNNTYPKYHTEDWDEDLLIKKLRNVLDSKRYRYLIVIDDIWDTNLWKRIKCAFINNVNGSRVITTSRIFEVAKNSDEVCELHPLSYDDSKKLFHERLTSNGTATDRVDEQSTKYILGKCGGLPLAIITIASLLVERAVVDWPEVCNSIGFGPRDDRAQDTKKILLFSYSDLPCHLKTCLLYLSIFPEDQEIDKNTLVWRWIAEGFVREEQGETLFKVGERYFYQLVNRSLIQPVVVGVDDQTYLGQIPTVIIHACRVHDMVLDFICSVAEKENFVTILGRDEQRSSSQNDARILAVQKRDLKVSKKKRDLKQQDLIHIPQRRVTTRSFNATSPTPALRETLDLLRPSFRSLRVLCLEGQGFMGTRKYKPNLVGLRHLRYLGLHSLDITELPREIGELRSLQVLNLTGDSILALPESVTLLTNLKFLQCDSRCQLPDRIGSLTSLEELRLSPPRYSSVKSWLHLGDLAKELGKLTNLRVLRIEDAPQIFRFCDDEGILEPLKNLKKMEELAIYDTSGTPKPNGWHGYSPSRALRYLCLINSEQPVWIDDSLENISYLNLVVNSAKLGDVNKLGTLPQLRSLVLEMNPPEDFHDDVAAGAFPKLRSFKTNYTLTYQQGAMPCLETVRFTIKQQADVCYDFDSLQHLLLLEKVEVTYWCKTKSGIEAITGALRRSVGIHPNRPIIDMKYYYDPEFDEEEDDGIENEMDCRWVEEKDKPIGQGIKMIYGGVANPIDLHPMEPWILAYYELAKEFKIWNCETLEPIMSFAGPFQSTIRSIKFIARKQWFFVAGGDDGCIYPYVYTSATVIKNVEKFKAHEGCVVSLDVHPSEPLVLSASTDENLIKLWNCADWTCIRIVPACSGFNRKVMFNPIDGNAFASLHYGGSQVQIWNISSRDRVARLVHPGNSKVVDFHYLSTGGDQLFMVTGSEDGIARVWDLNNNSCIRQVKGLKREESWGLENNRCIFSSVCVGQSHQGRPILITASRNHVISLYDCITYRCYRKIDLERYGGIHRGMVYSKSTRSLVIDSPRGLIVLDLDQFPLPEGPALPQQ